MESEEGWVTGDALKIALQLRAIAPGDLVWVKALSDEELSSFKIDKIDDPGFCTQPRQVTAVRSLISGWDLTVEGVDIINEEIAAWKPKTAG